MPKDWSVFSGFDNKFAKINLNTIYFLPLILVSTKMIKSWSTVKEKGGITYAKFMYK